MSSAPYQPSSFAQPASLRRRAVAFVLAAAANLLLILMLLGLAPTPFGPRAPDRTPATFRLLPDRPPEDPSRNAARKPRPAGGRPAPKEATKAPAPKAAARAEEAPPAPPLAMIIVSKDVLHQTDLAMNTRGSGAPAAGGTSGGGSGTQAGAGDGQGEGPGGEKLYNAEWYPMPPSDAEINGYRPKNFNQSGWGEVACRTVAGNRVEDCVELGQSPAGSGYARAVRQAAWQFRVRPPRVGDRRLVGAWVRIHIDYTITGGR